MKRGASQDEAAMAQAVLCSRIVWGCEVTESETEEHNSIFRCGERLLGINVRTMAELEIRNQRS
jgi:metal-dependent amidase/aminoacylase/carboxypeptidase family protein